MTLEAGNSSRKRQYTVLIEIPRKVSWFEILCRDRRIMLSLDDFDLVKQYRLWVGVNGYCYAAAIGGGRGAPQWLAHALVCERMGLKKADSALRFDHINRNKLDNRRSNLRVVTNAENIQNSDWKNKKLTPDDVRTIRIARGAGDREIDIARRYRVHRSTIADITQGRTWTNVK